MDEETKKTKVTSEIAENDFQLMLKAARVKWVRYCAAQGRDGELDREDIVDAIMDGIITIGENGFPTLHTENEDEKLSNIKIMRRPIRADKLVMDRIKEGNDIAKESALIGKYVGLSGSQVGQLEEADFKLLYSLCMIFLGK